jgi:hypothetical protein
VRAHTRAHQVSAASVGDPRRALDATRALRPQVQRALACAHSIVCTRIEEACRAMRARTDASRSSSSVPLQWRLCARLPRECPKFILSPAAAAQPFMRHRSYCHNMHMYILYSFAYDLSSLKYVVRGEEKDFRLPSTIGASSGALRLSACADSHLARARCCCTCASSSAASATSSARCASGSIVACAARCRRDARDRRLHSPRSRSDRSHACAYPCG